MSNTNYGEETKSQLKLDGNKVIVKNMCFIINK